MPPSRREVLRTAGATGFTLSAGCSSKIAGDDNSNSTSSLTSTTSLTESPIETPAHSPTATPSPVTADDFELHAAVLQQFTNDHPARVRFSVTNTSTRPFFMDPLSLGPLDDFVEADSIAVKLVLVRFRFHRSPGESEDSETHETATPPTDGPTDCWTLPAEYVFPRTLLVSDVRPGETFIDEYTCYSHRENEDCLPANEYRFTQAHEIRPGSITEGTVRGPRTQVQVRNILTIDDGGMLSIELETF